MKMRGAYVVKLDLTQPHLAGVADKVRAQADALEAVPADIDRYHLADGRVVCNGKPIASAGSGAIARRLAHYVLFHVVLSARREPLDFVYMRHQGSSPLLLWTLWRLRRRNPHMMVIAELPSWPYGVPGSLRGKALALLDRLSNRGLRRQVDRILTFSRAPEIFGIATIMTDNGVDVTRLAVLPAKLATGTFRMLGLANLSFWHGYDRVIEGIARYFAEGGTADVHFDIVGTGVELPRLHELVDRHRLHDRVHFHGAHRGAGLDAIMEASDIGISSIGMHRLDVDTSNLKSREFCARGLPFVLAYGDRDFPSAFPFVFHAPADETPLDIGAVLAFTRDLRSRNPQWRTDMRTYAEERLSWTAKMWPAIEAIRDHWNS